VGGVDARVSDLGSVADGAVPRPIEGTTIMTIAAYLISSLLVATACAVIGARHLAPARSRG
jgi:hypothetical protein